MRNTLIMGGITAATGGLNLFSIFLISVISGVGVYGAFAMVLAITTMVSNLLKLGLDAHIMKHCPPVIEQQGTQTALDYLRVNAAVVGGAIVGAILLAQALVAFFVGAGVFSITAMAISAAAVGLLLKVVIATLLRAQGAVLFSQYFLRLGDILIFVLLILLVWAIGSFAALTGTQLALLWAVAIVFNFILTLVVFARKITRGEQTPDPDTNTEVAFKAKFSELFYFSAINGVATLLQTLDVLLIGYLNGEANVGIYSILKRSVNQIYVVVGLFQIQYWSQLSIASAKSDQATIQTILRKARRAVSFSLPPLCMIATGLAYFLLVGAGVKVTLTLVITFGVLMVAMVINALFLFAATLANLNGLERFLFCTMALAGVVYLTILLLGAGDILVASFAFLLYQIGVNTMLAVRLWDTKKIHLFR